MNIYMQIAVKAVLFLLLITGYGLHVTQGQNLQMAWAKQFADARGRYGQAGNSLALDGERNVITTGNSNTRVDYDPGTGPADTFYLEAGTYISKLTTHGTFVWAKRIAANAGNGVITDRDGNIYVTGTFYGTVDFNPGKGVYNLSTFAGTVWGSGYLLKLNAAGEFLWARKIEGALCQNVTVDHMGNAYVCGTNENGEGFVTKYSPNGDEMLTRHFKRISASWLMEIYDVLVDTSGGIYITGHFSGAVDFDPDTVGTNILSVIGIHIFIAKLDSTGNLAWVKNIGPTMSSIYITHNIGFALAMDPAGNLLVTGYFYHTLDFNPGGAPILLSTVDPMASSAFILKLRNNNGEVVWATNLDNTWGYDIEVDERSNIYVLCRLNRDSTDMDPGPGVALVRGSGRMNVVINKHDSSGNFIWTLHWGGLELTDPREFALDPSLNIYTTGCFNHTTDFDPGADTFLMKTEWNNGMWASNAFIHKLMCMDTNSSQLTAATCDPFYNLNGITYQASGNYTQVRPNTSGCDSTIRLSLTLETVPQPVITVHEFYLGTVEKYNTYQWMLEDVPIPDATDSVYRVIENGNYTVAVTGGPGNCADTSAIYRVNNVTGIDDALYGEPPIVVYPNPATDKVYIAGSGLLHIQVIAPDGRILIQTTDKMVPLSGVAPGLYILYARDRSGRLVHTEKLVKK